MLPALTPASLGLGWSCCRSDVTWSQTCPRRALIKEGTAGVRARRFGQREKVIKKKRKWNLARDKRGGSTTQLGAPYVALISSRRRPFDRNLNNGRRSTNGAAEGNREAEVRGPEKCNIHRVGSEEGGLMRRDAPGRKSLYEKPGCPESRNSRQLAST